MRTTRSHVRHLASPNIAQPTQFKECRCMTLCNVVQTLRSTTHNKRSVSPNPAPLQIQEQGSFPVGGKTITNPGKFDPYKSTPEGQSFSGDHAYVFYQVPVKPRKYPLILWHGIGQFSKTWETTPDGREGYQNIFLRRRFSVYVMDQPRRGNASRSMAEATIKPVPDEQNWFGVFRIGIWPNYFPGVQFSKDPKALDQYFRQMAPDIGPIDLKWRPTPGRSCSIVRVLRFCVTHFHAGGLGWMTATKSANVRGIVSYEPGSNFEFPEGEVPPPQPSSGGAVEALAVPLRISRSSRSFRLSSTTETTFRRSLTTILDRMAGGQDLPWRACGEIP